jgi:hypothetical protein
MSKSERIASLEATVARLEELLSDPLALFTRALATASDEEAREWVIAAHAKIMAHTAEWDEDSSAAAAAPASKKKKVRAVSNREGPKEWNTFVTAILREMAATEGVDHSSFFEDVDEADAEAMKKAEASFKLAAKKAGVTWQDALKEASRRKDEAEGVDHSEKEAKKEAARKKRAAAKKAADAESDSESEAPPPKKEKKSKKEKKEKKSAGGAASASSAPSVPSDPRAAFLAELESVDMTIISLEDGSEFIAEKDGGEAFMLCEDGGAFSMGERVGVWDKDSNEIDYDA